MKAELLAPVAPRALVGGALERFGRLDILVNNASAFFPVPVGGMEPSHWEELIGSNLRAPLFISQQAAPELAKNEGSIVNIVDIHAERPLKGYAIYSVAKAGLAAATRSLAVELAPRVRVNGVAPGADRLAGGRPVPGRRAPAHHRHHAARARSARPTTSRARCTSSPARPTSPARSSRSTAAARFSSRGTAMAWLWLTLAGLLEIVWAIGLKYTDGFTRLLPSVVTVAAMIASVWFLALAVRTIPIGTGYAVWTGIGAVGVAILGMVLFDEPRTLLRILSILLIVAGIAGLKI